jgi:hypothetical protein
MDAMTMATSRQYHGSVMAPYYHVHGDLMAASWLY